MIIVRSPLRITLGGGGTDLPSFSGKYGGFCISAAINKYVYISVHRTYQEEIILKYSQLEHVNNTDEIKHPIIRECIKHLEFKTPQLEITSHADVPSNGSGLGSSGAFTVALLKGLYAHRNIPILPDVVAELACHINMDKLGMIQGKQDEYISALGGIACLTFQKDESVMHEPLNISHETLIDLEENLMLFYTGITHNTNNILKEQEEKTKKEDKDTIKNLLQLKEIGYASKKILEMGGMDSFAQLLNMQWKNKEARTATNLFIKDVRKGALENGALGMKLVGSGEGGFLLGYADDKRKLRTYMKTKGLEELRFKFDFEGVKVLVK